MTDLLEFIGGLLDGFALVAESMSLGGTTFCVVVHRAGRSIAGNERRAVEMALRHVVRFAFAVAALKIASIGVTTLAIFPELKVATVAPFLGTQVFIHTVVSSASAVLIGLGALWTRRHPDEGRRWIVLVALCTLFMINEAWLSHGNSRMTERALLMTLTVIHVAAGLTWAGGVGHLLVLWARCAQLQSWKPFWRVILRRFSPLGVAYMVVIVGFGTRLSLHYVANVDGLIGTGYGNMVVIKVALLAVILFFAVQNFHYTRRRTKSALQSRTPRFVEVEVALAISLLFCASTLASFPPPVDVEGETAAISEMGRMFAPKALQLSGPNIVMIEASEQTNVVTGEVAMAPYLDWDNFNHNVAGVIVICMAVLALLERLTRWQWPRHWPLLFMGFAVLIVCRQSRPLVVGAGRFHGKRDGC